MTDGCPRCQTYQSWLQESDDPFGHKERGREAERTFNYLMERLQITSVHGCNCRLGWNPQPIVIRGRRKYTVGPGFHPKGVAASEELN